MILVIISTASLLFVTIGFARKMRAGKLDFSENKKSELSSIDFYSAIEKKYQTYKRSLSNMRIKFNLN